MQGRWKESRIPPKKVRRGSMEMGRPDQPCLFVVLLLLAEVFPWWESSVVTMRSTGGFLIKVGSLILFACCFLLGLPPPNRGGILEFDGGLAHMVKRRRIGFIGSSRCGHGCTELSPSRRHGGSRRKMEVQHCSVSDDLGVEMLLIEEHSRSLLWRPTMEIIWWSTALASLASDFPTSMWRPFHNLATATPFPSTPSGFVPGAVADGRGWSLEFIGRSRGPNCVSYQLCRVFLVIRWDCFVIFFFLKVPSVKCTCFVEI